MRNPGETEIASAKESVCIYVYESVHNVWLSGCWVNKLNNVRLMRFLMLFTSPCFFFLFLDFATLLILTVVLFIFFTKMIGMALL